MDIQHGPYQQVRRPIRNRMRNLDELKLRQIADGGDHKPPSSELVTEFESAFDIVLPTDYIALLMYSNGGYPELDSVIPIGMNESGRLSINRFYRLDENRCDTEGLWRVMKVWKPILGHGLLPVASDGGGNQFVLDLRANACGVYFCIHDEKFLLQHVSDSFGKLIDSLHINPDFI